MRRRAASGTTGRARAGIQPAVLLPAVFLVAGLVAGAAARAGAQDVNPDAVLGLARVDSVAIAAPGRVTGFAWLGPDTLAVLVVGDAASDAAGRAGARLLVQDRRGAVLRSADVTGVLDRGLAWDGHALWSCGDVEGGGSKLYRLDPGPLTVAASFPTAGHRPAGVACDGRFVWLADRDAARLERFDTELGEITRTTPTPAFSPCGLAWDGLHLWVSDAGTGRLYRLSGPSRAWSGTVDAADFLWRGRPVHLSFNGRDLWYLAEGATHAVRVRLPER